MILLLLFFNIFIYFFRYLQFKQSFCCCEFQLNHRKSHTMCTNLQILCLLLLVFIIPAIISKLICVQLVDVRNFSCLLVKNSTFTLVDFYSFFFLNKHSIFTHANTWYFLCILSLLFFALSLSRWPYLNRGNDLTHTKNHKFFDS